MRSVRIVVFPGLQTLDAVGPTEVFATADRLRGKGEYNVELVAAEGGPVRTTSGLELGARRLPRRPPDTLVVAGGLGV